jgi:anti-sigma regulatory factor (Ser/Thr protein kinase)
MSGVLDPEAGQPPPASEAPVLMLDQPFDAGSLHLLRKAVLARAAAAGMPHARAAHVMLAVHELAANAVRHGAGTGQLRMWAGDGTLRCQVDDAGPPGPDGAAAGHDGHRTAAPTSPYQPGHGLWLVRQAARQDSVSSGPAWSRVVAVFTVPAAGTSRPGNQGPPPGHQPGDGTGDRCH